MIFILVSTPDKWQLLERRVYWENVIQRQTQSQFFCNITNMERFRNTGCFTHPDPFEMQNFRPKNFKISSN